MELIATMRAALFVPASRPDRFAKAAASGTDAVILDLEDAVAEPDKDAARAALSAKFTDRPVLVRINGTGTAWHAADLAAVAGGGFAAVMLPKAEGAGAVRAVAEACGVAVIALVETARGLAAAREIAASGAVARLAFGSIDYCADLGCDHVREALLSARTELILASRLAGIAPPLDGVTAQLDDPAATRDDAQYARTLGMAGKLCIHPRQVAEVQAAFRPSEAEVAWARRVLSVGDGAVSVDGQMVDLPVRRRAESILNAAGPA